MLRLLSIIGGLALLASCAANEENLKQQISRYFKLITSMLSMVLLAMLSGCTAAINYIDSVRNPHTDCATKPPSHNPRDEEAKRFVVPQGMAVLYVVKPGPLCLAPVDIYVDHEYFATLRAKGYGYTILAPGQHRIRSTAIQFAYDITLTSTVVKPNAIRVAEANFQAMAGHVYFYVQKYSPGDYDNYAEFRLVEMNDQEGRAMVMSSFLAHSNALTRNMEEGRGRPSERCRYGEPGEKSTFSDWKLPCIRDKTTE